MNDLVDRLRDRAYGKVPDRLAAEAANEIERLRLTVAEREAVEVAVEYVGSAYQVEHHAAVLRGLLERTK